MPHEEQYDHISEKMRDLIRLCLTPNPEKRPTATQLMEIVKNFKQLDHIELSDDALEIKKKQEENLMLKTKNKNQTYHQAKK